MQARRVSLDQLHRRVKVMVGVDECPAGIGEGGVLQRGGFEREDLARLVDDQMVVSGLPARMCGPAPRLGQIGSSQDGPRD